VLNVLFCSAFQAKILPRGSRVHLRGRRLRRAKDGRDRGRVCGHRGQRESSSKNACPYLIIERRLER
jgi:hypothetical protein